MDGPSHRWVYRRLKDWAELGVEGHFEAKHPWYSYHEIFREPAAALVGALPGEVVMMNTLTTNLHLMMVSFYRPTSNRFKILVEQGAFPSDQYAVASQARYHGYDPAEAIVTLRPRDGEDTIRTEMRRNDPPIGIGDISTQGGRLSFMVRDVSQLDAAVERARQQTQAVGVTGQRDWNVAVVDGTRIVMSPSQAGLDDAADKAMQTATEVVRKRIDELGTKEPTIVREGATRILVQVPGLQDPNGLKALLGKTAKLEFKLVDLTADPAMVAQGKAPPGSQVVPYPDNPAGGKVIAVQRRVIISGDDLIDARDALLARMAEVHARHGGSVLALMEVPREQISRYGCAAVAGTGEHDVVRVTDLVEKPSPDRTKDAAPARTASQ